MLRDFPRALFSETLLTRVDLKIDASKSVR